MTPKELEEIYDKEIKPFFDEWRKAEKEYWSYLGQFFAASINGSLSWEGVKAFTVEEAEKLEKMRKNVEQKEKKNNEVFNRWIALFH
jgi:hypothetical protein